MDLSEFNNNISNKYIIIEETQFFRDLIVVCNRSSRNKNKNVIVVGLDGDLP